MDRDKGSTASNARPQGTIVPATIMAPVISGVTQRTRHEIVYVITSTRTDGANMQDVVDG